MCQFDTDTDDNYLVNKRVAIKERTDEATDVSLEHRGRGAELSGDQVTGLGGVKLDNSSAWDRHLTGTRQIVRVDSATTTSKVVWTRDSLWGARWTRWASMTLVTCGARVRCASMTLTLVTTTTPGMQRLPGKRQLPKLLKLVQNIGGRTQW